MSDKVKLPKVVSEAMDRVFHSNESFMKEKHFHEIMQIKIETPCTPDQEIIYNYFYGHGWLILAESLIKGYEVEQTPEDKVREFYQMATDTSKSTIRKMLELLGHKIDGINT